MSYSALRLRPLSVGDLFDETIRLYRQNMIRFIGIGAVVTVPGTILQVLPVVAEELLGQAGSVLAGLLFLLLILPLMIAYIAMFAATVHAVSEACLGRSATVGSAYAHGFRRFLPLLGLTIVFLVVTGIAFTPLGVVVGLISLLQFSDSPAIVLLTLTMAGILLVTMVGWTYLIITWGFAFHALVVEGLGIRAALGRSRSLVRGSWWRVLGITLLFSLFVGTISSLFWVVSFIPLSIAAALEGAGPAAIVALVVGVLIGFAGQVILAPLTYVAWTLLYYDLRVRKEGFDLELLARELEAPSQLGATRG